MAIHPHHPSELVVMGSDGDPGPLQKAMEGPTVSRSPADVRGSQHVGGTPAASGGVGGEGTYLTHFWV